jgi:hypothetical protein
MFNLNHIMTDFYKHNEANLNVDVVTALSGNWRSFSQKDEEVSMFSLHPKTAKWLLHTLKHNKVTPKQSEHIRRLSKVLSNDGIKGCMPREPIKINPTTNTLLSGVTRLYSLAMAEKGTFYAIEFTEE